MHGRRHSKKHLLYTCMYTLFTIWPSTNHNRFTKHPHNPTFTACDMITLVSNVTLTYFISHTAWYYFSMYECSCILNSLTVEARCQPFSPYLVHNVRYTNTTPYSYLPHITCIPGSCYCYVLPGLKHTLL